MIYFYLIIKFFIYVEVSTVQCSCSNGVFTIKRLTIINILIRIKTDSFFFFLLCIVLLKVKVTWHTRNLCSAFNPSKVHTHTHTPWTHTHTVNTHTPGAVGSHLYCILMLVIMVVLGKPNIFWGGAWCKKFENHWCRRCKVNMVKNSLCLSRHYKGEPGSLEIMLYAGDYVCSYMA